VIIKRRSFLIGGLTSLFAAPAIVKASSLMPLRGVPLSSLMPLDGVLMREITKYEVGDDDNISRLGVLYFRPEWTVINQQLIEARGIVRRLVTPRDYYAAH
jgi:hypothetical protein